MAGSLSVGLSVCPIIRPSHAAAAGSLLCVGRAGDIARFLHGRRSAAAAPQRDVQQQMRAVSRCQLT